MKFLLLLFLILSSSAFSSIVYTNITDQTISYGESYYVDFDGILGSDVTFTGNGLTNFTVMVIADGVALEMGDVKKFSSGSSIGSSSTWSTGGSQWINPNWAPNNFPVGTDGFVGIKFVVSGGTHYGWIRVTYYTDYFVIKSYAYENAANTSITAGSTTSGGGGGGSGGGGSSSWIDVRAEHNVTGVAPGASVEMRAYIMPNDSEIISVDWSVINTDGTASITNNGPLDNGVLTGITEGQVTVQATSPSFPSLSAGSLNMLVSYLAVGVDNNISNTFSIHPNPFNDYLTVNVCDECKDNTIVIRDINGTQIFQSNLTIGNNKIFSGNFPFGLYFAEVRGAKGVQYFKLVK